MNLGASPLARAQNGNLTWDQLIAAGLTPAMIKTRSHNGELVWQFPRVYAVGDPRLIPLCREAGALLSVGPRAVLSHESAAAVWELAPGDPDQIHLTVVGRNPKPRSGVRIHRTNNLYAEDVGTKRNLRLTSPARTIIDCAPRIDVARAAADAMAKGILRPHELAEALARARRNHPGVPIVRAHADGGPVLTRSGKERKLRKLLKAAELPMPQTNTRLAGFEVDFYWPEYGLVVEIDAFGTHGSRRSFESDRRKDQLLATRAGVSVLRFTAEQLDREPLRVIATIAHSIARHTASAA